MIAIIHVNNVYLIKYYNCIMGREMTSQHPSSQTVNIMCHEHTISMAAQYNI